MRSLLLLFAALFTGVSLAAAPVIKPNIVVIFADDLGYADLSIQGSPDIKTPRIDSIATRGVRFTAGYVTAPQCSPSRVGLLTGVHQQRFGHETNLTMRAALDNRARLIPAHLKPAGYTAALFGKWHLGERDPAHHPSKHGFATVFDSKAYAAADAAGQLTLAGEKVSGQRYENLIDCERAAAYIAQKHDQPFFLYLAPMSPHVPQVYAPKYEAVFAAAQGSEKRRHCIAMMAELDDGVGLVLDALRTAGIEENTLVFFISDNGGVEPQNASLNTPLRGKKGDVYEGGIRVPFLAQWPGTMPAGQVYNHPVSTLDVLPTALALAQTPPLAGVTPDGVNLLPFLTGKNPAAPHDRLFWRWTFRGTPKRAVRAGDWKWVRTGEAPAELYHVTNDIGEATNLAAAEPAKVAELASAYETWAASLPPIAPQDNQGGPRSE
jgi:arylsulfatase A-like enzyme